MKISILAVVSPWGEGFLKRISPPDLPRAEIVFVSPNEALKRGDFFNLAQEFDVVILSISFEADLVEVERMVAEQFLTNGGTVIFLLSPLAVFGEHFGDWSADDEGNTECLVRGSAIMVVTPADRMALRTILPNSSCPKMSLIYDPLFGQLFPRSDERRAFEERTASRARIRNRLGIFSPEHDGKPLVFLGPRDRLLCSNLGLGSCFVVDREVNVLGSEDLIPGVDVVISDLPDHLTAAACCRVPALTLGGKATKSEALLAYWPARIVSLDELAGLIGLIGDPASWADIGRNIVDRQRILFPRSGMSSPEMVNHAGLCLERVLKHAELVA